MFRIPGVCNRDWSTTVLAHFREAHVAGIAEKPNDLVAAFACHACHDVVDGRNPNVGWHDEDSLRQCKLEALVRTLDYWHEHGQFSYNAAGELRWEEI